MKNILTLVVLIIMIVPREDLRAQVYAESNSEIIFSFADVENLGQSVPTNMRFTLFFHLGQNICYDFSDRFGIYSGYGIRNIGLITEDNDIKIKRRTYSFGVPLAIKAGALDKHLYFYGGGECELFFHYKQKKFIEGDKIKESEWFSDRTKRFMPSLFAGVQFPGGVNLKIKYYSGNFLNRDFSGRDFGEPVDYSGFNRTRIVYIALSMNIKNEKVKKMYSPGTKVVRYASL